MKYIERKIYFIKEAIYKENKLSYTDNLYVTTNKRDAYRQFGKLAKQDIEKCDHMTIFLQTKGWDDSDNLLEITKMWLVYKDRHIVML